MKPTWNIVLSLGLLMTIKHFFALQMQILQSNYIM